MYRDNESLKCEKKREKKDARRNSGREKLQKKVDLVKSWLKVGSKAFLIQF